ncbi:HpcH/HpaI aldolase/citrate lyase [Aureococcus anophagefferens]|nr:HpcH/HpaI aldolase/citrate lyase [Aureococcus anophagefferens]
MEALRLAARRFTATRCLARATTRRLSSAPGSANAFRAKLQTRPRGCSLQFAVIPSPVVTQAMAAAGADAICIDLEHGPIDYKDAQAMVASGVVFPLACTAADVERAVRTLHYPPRGDRGFGLCGVRKGFEFAEAAAHYERNPPLCVVLIETAEAVDNIDAILAVEGVDAFQLAQFDLSTALGASGRFDDPGFLAAERRVEEAAFARGVPSAPSR